MSMVRGLLMKGICQYNYAYTVISPLKFPFPTYDPRLLPCYLEVNHKISLMLQEATSTQLIAFRGFLTYYMLTFFFEV